ncbi:MAG: hypothetical protein OHK0039_43870 [Bacteroidia bacterium]
MIDAMYARQTLALLGLLALWACHDPAPTDYRDAWVGDYRLVQTCALWVDSLEDGQRFDTLVGTVQKSDEPEKMFVLGYTVRVGTDGAFAADPALAGLATFEGHFVSDLDLEASYRSSGSQDWELCDITGRKQK